MPAFSYIPGQLRTIRLALRTIPRPRRIMARAERGSHMRHITIAAAVPTAQPKSIPLKYPLIVGPPFLWRTAVRIRPIR